jgi:hypothetical protein
MGAEAEPPHQQRTQKPAAARSHLQLQEKGHTTHHRYKPRAWYGEGVCLTPASDAGGGDVCKMHADDRGNATALTRAPKRGADNDAGSVMSVRMDSSAQPKEAGSAVASTPEGTSPPARGRAGAAISTVQSLLTVG